PAGRVISYEDAVGAPSVSGATGRGAVLTDEQLAALPPSGGHVVTYEQATGQPSNGQLLTDEQFLSAGSPPAPSDRPDAPPNNAGTAIARAPGAIAGLPALVGHGANWLAAKVLNSTAGPGERDNY